MAATTLPSLPRLPRLVLGTRWALGLETIPTDGDFVGVGILGLRRRGFIRLWDVAHWHVGAVALFLLLRRIGLFLEEEPQHFV